MNGFHSTNNDLKKMRDTMDTHNGNGDLKVKKKKKKAKDSKKHADKNGQDANPFKLTPTPKQEDATLPTFSMSEDNVEKKPKKKEPTRAQIEAQVKRDEEK